MIFSITKKDISTGVRACCGFCPVALAIKRRVVGQVTVDDNLVVVNGIAYDPPESVVNFIQAFDAGRPVKPLRFMLPLECE